MIPSQPLRSQHTSFRHTVAVWYSTECHQFCLSLREQRLKCDRFACWFAGSSIRSASPKAIQTSTLPLCDMSLARSSPTRLLLLPLLALSSCTRDAAAWSRCQLGPHKPTMWIVACHVVEARCEPIRRVHALSYWVRLKYTGLRLASPTNCTRCTLLCLRASLTTPSVW